MAPSSSPCNDNVPKARPLPQQQHYQKWSFEPKPVDIWQAKRAPQPRQPAGGYQGGYYGGYGVESEVLPEAAVAPDEPEVWCDGDKGDVGDDPEELDGGCPFQRASMGFGGGGFGGVGKQQRRPTRRVLKAPARDEICRGEDGLVVVRLLSTPSEVEMVCASINASAANVTKGNKRFVADIIRKCAYDSEQLLVGGWYGDAGYPRLVTSPKRGQVKQRSRIEPAPVLCQL